MVSKQGRMQKEFGWFGVIPGSDNYSNQCFAGWSYITLDDQNAGFIATSRDQLRAWLLLDMVV